MRVLWQDLTRVLGNSDFIKRKRKLGTNFLLVFSFEKFNLEDEKNVRKHFNEHFRTYHSKHYIKSRIRARTQLSACRLGSPTSSHLHTVHSQNCNKIYIGWSRAIQEKDNLLKLKGSLLTRISFYRNGWMSYHVKFKKYFSFMGCEFKIIGIFEHNKLSWFDELRDTKFLLLFRTLRKICIFQTGEVFWKTTIHIYLTFLKHKR